MRTILLLISLILGVPAAAWCVDPIKISNWSVLRPFLAAPRDGGIDHLLDYGGSGLRDRALIHVTQIRRRTGVFLRELVFAWLKEIPEALPVECQSWLAQ